MFYVMLFEFKGSPSANVLLDVQPVIPKIM